MFRFIAMLAQVAIFYTSFFVFHSYAAPPAPIPQTGQITIYAAGDDGAIQDGVAWSNSRYMNNANGTVSDQLTGLMWSGSANAPGPAACGPNAGKSWLDALAYAACLNTGNYLGYADWRVPTIRELGSLIDISRFSPALTVNHPFSSVQRGAYWSSTTTAAGNTSAWGINMDSGELISLPKAGNGYAWPVRTMNQTFSISGMVSLQDGSGGLAGTTVKLYKATVSIYSIYGLYGADVTVGAGLGSAITGAGGTYTLTGVKSGSYLVIPSRTGYVFNPDKTPVITITNSGNVYLYNPEGTGNSLIGDTVNGIIYNSLFMATNGVIYRDFKASLPGGGGLR